MAGGLQYYFIGADGNAQPGPWIRPFSELATLGTASIYSGTNPKTGKAIQIYYLPAEQIIRISTFYPDNAIRHRQALRLHRRQQPLT